MHNERANANTGPAGVTEAPRRSAARVEFSLLCPHCGGKGRIRLYAEERFCFDCGGLGELVFALAFTQAQIASLGNLVQRLGSYATARR